MKILDKMKKKKEYKEAINYFENIGSTIEFKYKGKWGSICDFKDFYGMVYDGEYREVHSMEEVRKTKWIGGKCLDEIYAEADFDYC